MKPILEIQNISKKFRIHHENQAYLSLRDSIINTIKSPFNSLKGNSNEDFYALNDISFNVMPGESIGIIGKNGAGKSTLLKILSKITPPSSGKIISRGRIASLLEVGTGFHPELSGQENIFMNGSILGMSRKEIIKNFDAIVNFAGVEKFIDTPLKHYSSGMQLRLAFAVAAFLENEVLIIDEVLAVGDSEFQKKCTGKINDISKNGKTILFVSHQMGLTSQLCHRGILLENGKIKKDSDINTIINNYWDSSTSSINISPQANSKIELTKVTITKNNQIESFSFETDNDIYITFNLNIKTNSKLYSIFVTITNSFQSPVFSAETLIINKQITLKICKNFLTEGTYNVNIRIHIPNKELVFHSENLISFSIIDTKSKFIAYNSTNYFYGSVFGNYEWI